MDILELINYIIAYIDPDNVCMAISPFLTSGIALASSIGNAIFGGISANKQRKEQLATLNKMKRENNNWYNRRYNEDATQRADAQRMLSMTNEAIKKRNQAARGKQKVTGGTDASLAGTQQRNAEAVGNALATTTVNAQNRKDNIEAQYRNTNNEIEAQKSGVKAASEEAKRNNTANAVTGALAATSAIAANNDIDNISKKASKSIPSPQSVMGVDRNGNPVSVNPDTVDDNNLYLIQRKKW